MSVRPFASEDLADIIDGSFPTGAIGADTSSAAASSLATIDDEETKDTYMA